MTASLLVRYALCGVLPATPFPQESHHFPSHLASFGGTETYAKVVTVSGDSL
ncbi:hypothetical protein [Halobacillus mangrovi]|uniref:hypothetical protein n=1 Tax=Halobacillus mangrovi TaxID=402384 RepID=UPI003D9524AB